MDVERITAEELLVHAAGLRRLAIRLVADSADEDDLVQATLVAGLENPPTRTQPLFNWLVHVVKKFATARRRIDTRREQTVARSEAIAVGRGCESRAGPLELAVRSGEFPRRRPRQRISAAGSSRYRRGAQGAIDALLSRRP